jgi:hypothetical protein
MQISQTIVNEITRYFLFSTELEVLPKFFWSHNFEFTALKAKAQGLLLHSGYFVPSKRSI